MKIFLFLCGFISTIHFCQAQFEVPKNIKPDSSTYANIYVKKLFSDEKASVFVIWVKKDVGAHYHQHHTEVVTVLDGKGIMKLGDKEQRIKKGDFIIIPMGTAHSVVTTSRKPLKVVSIQSPKFTGEDRVFVK